MSAQWNLKNPAVKRIVQELKEIQRDDSPDIVAEALEENIFEWHFAIRGAWETPFAGGIYHGRILMPADYPFKPPAFVMLTPSGRFETGTKICLSISSFHPESWQPSWSVRSALVALIAFMQSPGNGAIGSLDTSDEVRKHMAEEARDTPPKHANSDRQELINTLHQRMLEMEEKSKQLHRQESKETDDNVSSGGDNHGPVLFPSHLKPMEEANMNIINKGEVTSTSVEEHHRNRSQDNEEVVFCQSPGVVINSRNINRSNDDDNDGNKNFAGEGSNQDGVSNTENRNTRGWREDSATTSSRGPATPSPPTRAAAATRHWAEDNILTYVAVFLVLFLSVILLKRLVHALGLIVSPSRDASAFTFSVHPDIDIEL